MHLISAMHPFLLTISSFLTAAVAVWGCMGMAEGQRTVLRLAILGPFTV